MVVLVTGGAVRIGREICLAFARTGAAVVVHYRRSAAAAEALLAELNQLGGGHRLVAGDLVCAAVRERLIADLLASGCRPTCLVNNASTYRRRPLAKVDEACLREDFEINFMVPFLLMRDFANHCGEGCIVNLLDQRVAAVEPSAGAYGLAKKCLRDATEAAALEWAPRIRVNAVAPGLVLPPPGVSPAKMLPLLANVPMGEASPATEVAAACVYLASTPSITGQTLFVDGGLHLTRPLRPELAEADYAPPATPSG